MPSTDPPDRAKKALAALVQTASVEGSAKETDEVAALEKSIEPLLEFTDDHANEDVLRKTAENLETQLPALIWSFPEATVAVIHAFQILIWVPHLQHAYQTQRQKEPKSSIRALESVMRALNLALRDALEHGSQAQRKECIKAAGTALFQHWVQLLASPTGRNLPADTRANVIASIHEYSQSTEAKALWHRAVKAPTLGDLIGSAGLYGEAVDLLELAFRLSRSLPATRTGTAKVRTKYCNELFSFVREARSTGSPGGSSDGSKKTPSSKHNAQTAAALAKKLEQASVGEFDEVASEILKVLGDLHEQRPQRCQAVALQMGTENLEVIPRWMPINMGTFDVWLNDDRVTFEVKEPAALREGSAPEDAQSVQVDLLYCHIRFVLFETGSGGPLCKIAYSDRILVDQEPFGDSATILLDADQASRLASLFRLRGVMVQSEPPLGRETNVSGDGKLRSQAKRVKLNLPADLDLTDKLHARYKNRKQSIAASIDSSAAWPDDDAESIESFGSNRERDGVNKGTATKSQEVSGGPFPKGSESTSTANVASQAERRDDGHAKAKPNVKSGQKNVPSTAEEPQPIDSRSSQLTLSARRHAVETLACLDDNFNQLASSSSEAGRQALPSAPALLAVDSQIPDECAPPPTARAPPEVRLIPATQTSNTADTSGAPSRSQHNDEAAKPSARTLQSPSSSPASKTGSKPPSSMESKLKQQLQSETPVRWSGRKMGTTASQQTRPNAADLKANAACPSKIGIESEESELSELESDYTPPEKKKPAPAQFSYPTPKEPAAKHWPSAEQSEGAEPKRAAPAPSKNGSKRKRTVEEAEDNTHELRRLPVKETAIQTRKKTKIGEARDTESNIEDEGDEQAVEQSLQELAVSPPKPRKTFASAQKAQRQARIEVKPTKNKSDPAKRSRRIQNFDSGGEIDYGELPGAATKEMARSDDKSERSPRRKAGVDDAATVEANAPAQEQSVKAPVKAHGKRPQTRSLRRFSDLSSSSDCERDEAAKGPITGTDREKQQALRSKTSQKKDSRAAAKKQRASDELLSGKYTPDGQSGTKDVIPPNGESAAADKLAPFAGRAGSAREGSVPLLEPPTLSHRSESPTPKSPVAPWMTARHTNIVTKNQHPPKASKDEPTTTAPEQTSNPFLEEMHSSDLVLVESGGYDVDSIQSGEPPKRVRDDVTGPAREADTAKPADQSPPSRGQTRDSQTTCQQSLLRRLSTLPVPCHPDSCGPTQAPSSAPERSPRQIPIGSSSSPSINPPREPRSLPRKISQGAVGQEPGPASSNQAVRSDRSIAFQAIVGRKASVGGTLTLAPARALLREHPRSPSLGRGSQSRATLSTNSASLHDNAPDLKEPEEHRGIFPKADGRRQSMPLAQFVEQTIVLTAEEWKVLQAVRERRQHRDSSVAFDSSPSAAVLDAEHEPRMSGIETTASLSDVGGPITRSRARTGEQEPSTMRINPESASRKELEKCATEADQSHSAGKSNRAGIETRARTRLVTRLQCTSGQEGDLGKVTPSGGTTTKEALSSTRKIRQALFTARGEAKAQEQVAVAAEKDIVQEIERQASKIAKMLSSNLRENVTLRKTFMRSELQNLYRQAGEGLEDLCNESAAIYESFVVRYEAVRANEGKVRKALAGGVEPFQALHSALEQAAKAASTNERRNMLPDSLF